MSNDDKEEVKIMRGYKVFIVLMFSIILSAGVAQAADPIVIGSVEPFSPPGSIEQGLPLCFR